MTRPLRIGFARVAQETNSFSPLPTVLSDFERFHWLSGDALLARCSRRGVEAPRFLRHAELSGFVQAARAMEPSAELVPLLSAWAIPGGPLTAGCLAELTAALVAALEAAGPLDGLMLSMHGAMGAEGSDAPEADLLEAARGVVGPGTRIALTLDLHAQLGRRFAEGADVLLAYRTNPHRDHRRVGARAGRLLIRTLRGELRPTSAWHSLPMVLGGGTTIDFLPPMRSVYRWMRRAERRPGVLSLSAFNAHLWCRSPDLGWAAHATTDDDPALAEALADELASRLWDTRTTPPPAFLSPTEAIDRARAARGRRWLGTVCMSDASDLVGAGAPGENTQVLRALLRDAADLRSLVPIRDDAAVQALWDAPIGQEVEVPVGGRFNPEDDPPLTVRGRLRQRLQTEEIGRMVALDLGPVQLVITEGPPLAMKPAFYSDLGLSPWRADVVVVKSLFPFRWYFLAQNRLTLYVKTRGATDLDRGLDGPFSRPVHPRDPVAGWRPSPGGV